MTEPFDLEHALAGAPNELLRHENQWLTEDVKKLQRHFEVAQESAKSLSEENAILSRRLVSAEAALVKYGFIANANGDWFIPVAEVVGLDKAKGGETAQNDRISALDYFAGMAMTQLIEGSDSCEEVARFAYNFAEKMVL